MNQGLRDQIEQLDDTSALRVLAAVAGAHNHGGSDASMPDAAAIAALRAELEVSPTAAPPADGEAARAALLLLAEDETLARPITTLVRGTPPQRMDVGTALLSAGLIFALQTHVEFHRREDGTWSLKIVKKPTNAKVFAPLIDKLMTLLPK